MGATGEAPWVSWKPEQNWERRQKWCPWRPGKGHPGKKGRHPVDPGSEWLRLQAETRVSHLPRCSLALRRKTPESVAGHHQCVVKRKWFTSPTQVKTEGHP